MNKLFLAVPFFAFATTVNAQQGPLLTVKDYERAESFLNYNTAPLIDYDSVRPEWLPGDKFWYRTLTPKGSEFISVDPAKKTRSAAFDQQKLAAALSKATGKVYEAEMLPFSSFSLSADGKLIIFEAEGKQWSCDLQTYECKPDNSHLASGGGRSRGRRIRAIEIASPDGTKEAFIKDYNLWIREVKTHKETQLTTDGDKRFWLCY